MNLRRFAARNSRDALAMVRHALGEDAVVLSTKPVAEGVEVLAMAGEGLQQLQQAASHAPLLRARPSAAEGVGAASSFAGASAAPSPASAAPTPATPSASVWARRVPGAGPRREPMWEPDTAAQSVAQDVQTLGMSTLSFQDYVRERMLQRRQVELIAQQRAQQDSAAAAHAAPVHATTPPLRDIASAMRAARVPDAGAVPAPARREPPVLRDEIRLDLRADQQERQDLMSELRSMKGLIEQRFGALAFMEKLQRDPRQAALSQTLLDAGFSPALVRKLLQALPAAPAEALDWATQVLERNLHAVDAGHALGDEGGVFALIGSTGVGKTTTTAKMAAAFAARHGAGQLGLVTLDAYRVAAHEQLRAYGRILGVPVHTAHDRASLDDLLELLAGKKLVLIDTAGMAQRDSRTAELLDMLGHARIHRLLVLNAAAQGETIEDVLQSYRASACRGVVLSKLDEAVKLGPALDALIRHRLSVLGVANGQRVPEDWHHLSAQALVQRALRGSGNPAWHLDAGDVNLVLAASAMRTDAALNAGVAR